MVLYNSRVYGLWLVGQVKWDLPPKQEVQISVKLSPAQHMVYKNLLVNQDRPTLDAIMAEAQRYGHVVKDGNGRFLPRGDGVHDGGSSRMAGKFSSGEGGLMRGGEATGKGLNVNDMDCRKLMSMVLRLR